MKKSTAVNMLLMQPGLSDSAGTVCTKITSTVRFVPWPSACEADPLLTPTGCSSVQAEARASPVPLAASHGCRAGL